MDSFDSMESTTSVAQQSQNLCQKPKEKPQREARDGESSRSRVESREVESRVLEELHPFSWEAIYFEQGVLNSREFCCLCRSEYFNAHHQVDLLRPTQSKVEQHFFILPRRYRIPDTNTTTEAPKSAIDSNRTVFIGINQRNNHGPISS